MLLALMIVLSTQPARAEQAVVAVDYYAEYTRAHTITLDFDQPGMTADGPRVTVATRTWDGGEQVINSAECPAVEAVAQAYSALPDSGADRLPIGPTLKDGFPTVVTIRTLSPDDVWTEQKPGREEFAIWGDYVVRSLIPCWGPLTPQ